MNPYLNASLFATALGAVALIAHKQLYGGAVEAQTQTLLMTGVISSMVTGFFPGLVPSVVAWVTTIFSGGKSNTTDIQKLIEIAIQQLIKVTPAMPSETAIVQAGALDVIKALIAAYSKGGIPAVVFEALQKFRLDGVPQWLYIGGGWSGTNPYVIQFGQVPPTLPIPPAPPQPVKQVVHQEPTPVVVKTVTP